MAQADSANTTRRDLLRFAAAAPLAGLAAQPALAGEPDPIFAAIARHKEACIALDIVNAEQDAAIERARGKPEFQSVFDASEEVTDAAIDVEIEVLEDALDTTPTSLAGVLAIVDYLHSNRHLAVFERNDPYDFLEMIGAAIDDLTAA